MHFRGQKERNTLKAALKSQMLLIMQLLSMLRFTTAN